MKTTSTEERVPTIPIDSWPSTTPSTLFIRPSISCQQSILTRSSPTAVRWTSTSTAMKTILSLFSTRLTKRAANTLSLLTSTQQPTLALTMRAKSGAQTLGMSCAEAIFLLGCERNSDVIVGSAYGALIKSYNEAPDTVAVIKHTANEILYSISYYVQKLFADNMGTKTLPVTATNGGFGPVYWSATANSSSTILKLVNYDGMTGSSNAVQVNIEGSSKTTATNSTSVNNLPTLGGESSTITTTTLSGSSGSFSVSFSNPYEIAILVV